MKKMLLVSMLQNATGLLKAVEPNLKGKTVTYIPTASRVERLGFFIRTEKWVLKSLGLTVDELEVSASSHETIQRKLEQNDYIYVTGGNTFYLLQELKRTGADQLIVKEVNNGKLYIGESAGAIVVAPDIGYSAAMDDPGKAPGLKDYAGLHLIHSYIVPHDQNREFKKAVGQIVNDYSATLDLKVIDDRHAVLVEDDTMRILGK